MTVEEKLELYKKAFCLFVNWAEECDFGYDNLGNTYYEYESELEEKDLSYIEGLMYIALKEAEKKENISEIDIKKYTNVDKAIFN